MIVGGYWDGKLLLISTDNDSVIDLYNYHQDTITCLALDPKETVLITGKISRLTFRREKRRGFPLNPGKGVEIEPEIPV